VNRITTIRGIMIDDTEKWLLDPKTTQADIERIANSEEDES